MNPYRILLSLILTCASPVATATPASKAQAGVSGKSTAVIHWCRPLCEDRGGDQHPIHNHE